MFSEKPKILHADERPKDADETMEVDLIAKIIGANEVVTHQNPNPASLPSEISVGTPPHPVFNQARQLEHPNKTQANLSPDQAHPKRPPQTLQ